MTKNESAPKTKIYTAFFSSGLQRECMIYPIYHPEVDVTSNREIVGKLRKKCEEIEFVGETEPSGPEETIANVEEKRKDLDGILLFGSPPEKLASLGLPMVAVHPLWGRWMPPFNAYQGMNILTAFLPVLKDKDPSIYSSRIEDIAAKVKLIDVISRMKRLRVLVVTDLPNLGYFEPMQIQIDTTRERYEKAYLANLDKTFGAQLVAVPQKELFEKMEAADGEKADETARKWIDQAVTVRGTNRDEVVKSAKLYLAMKELLEKYDCNAITTEGYGWPGFEKGPFPSQGLASSQLCTEGIVATSETLVDSLITQQLGLYITGSPGFNGDYILDPFRNVAIIGHCEGSFNPYGDGKKAPYVIRNLPMMEENQGGACAEIRYPIGETITVAKVSMRHRKISLFQGEAISGEELFPYWDDILCRTKMAIKTDAKTLLQNLDWRTFGNHRVAFCGDYRQEIKDLAKLTGLDIVEEDG